MFFKESQQKHLTKFLFNMIIVLFFTDVTDSWSLDNLLTKAKYSV